MKQLAKLLGIDIPDFQPPPNIVPALDQDLAAITTPATVPLPIFDVAGGGLNEGAIADTARAIAGNLKRIRAELFHLGQQFHALNRPLSVATFALDLDIQAARRDAERALLDRATRYPNYGYASNRPNPWPVAMRYPQEVALARGHLHTARMWTYLMANAPPLPTEPPKGFVLPLTAQERAVSVQAAQERFREQRAISNPNYRLEPGIAVYPHLATPATPARATTYSELVDYAKRQYDQAQWAMDLDNPQRAKTAAALQAAAAAAKEWHGFWQSIAAKWSPTALNAAEGTAVAATRAPHEQWLAAHAAQKAAYIAAHPELQGEFAHAKTLLMPHQRMGGQGTVGSDGTRLEYPKP